MARKDKIKDRKGPDARLTLVDVGARGGIHERWKPFRHYIEAYGFELDAGECARLNAAAQGITYLPVAVGAVDGELATLHITSKASCSSLLPPSRKLCSEFSYAADAMRVVSTSEVALSRLDTICRREQISPDVLKIDTQGTELDVLIGAGEYLQRAIAVELEVEFMEQYEGQALFADIDQYMRSQGFTLRGIRRTYWRNDHQSEISAHGGQLVHGDALYLRVESKPQVYITLAAYRQYDLLRGLVATEPEWQWLVPKPTRTQRVASALFSGWSNRQLRSVADFVRSRGATDWHDPEFF